MKEMGWGQTPYKPPRLQRGMGIGVFSASSPVSADSPTRYLRGKQYLQQQGFRVVDGKLFGKADNYRSGSIRERAEELNDLLHDDRVDVLMASIGGNNTNSILPYLDYDYLRTHPKLIVGYSDTTALLLAVYARTGLVTFYGPSLAASFGEFPPFVDETFQNFWKVASGEEAIPYSHPQPPFWTEEFIDWEQQDRPKKALPNRWRCVRPGRAEGRLIGGNLNTMEGIFGTPYMPEIEPGDILLLEDCCKNASTIERSFSLLKLAGVFDRVGGILLGKHERFDNSGTGRRPDEILLEVLGEREIPILADFDSCHTHPMLTMPIGCRVALDAENKQVQLLEMPVT